MKTTVLNDSQRKAKQSVIIFNFSAGWLMMSADADEIEMMKKEILKL